MCHSPPSSTGQFSVHTGIVYPSNVLEEVVARGEAGEEAIVSSFYYVLACLSGLAMLLFSPDVSVFIATS